MKKTDFEYILGLLKKYVGWELSEDKYFVLDRKIYNFVREKDYSTVEDLISDLRNGQKTLLWQVIEALTLSDTCFFRDYKVFSGFENRILPHLREANRSAKKLRIWSMGCSSGQETYSIAISVRNRLFAVSDWDIKIIGTDISTASISKAQKGAYTPFEIQMGMNARTMIDNFHQDGEMWQANRNIMDMVEFRRYNMLDDITFSDAFDIIFCRNVLRFFSVEAQADMIRSIYKNQVPGGFLYLGMGENIADLDKYYDPIRGMKCLYQAKLSVSKPEVTPRSSNAGGEQTPREAPAMPKFVRPDNLRSIGSGTLRSVDPNRYRRN